MASGLQKRRSLNYFDPEVQTRNPPLPPKKEKKRTSILEIAQRSQSTPAEENVSIFSGVETKRRQSRLRKSKVKGHSSSKSVDYAVYRLDTPNLAAKVNQDTDIDLSFSDLGYLAHLYKNSLNRSHLNNDNIDSPATTKRKFRSYVGHSETSLNPDLYESVNHDLMQIPKERRRKESLLVQSPRKSLAEEVNNRASISLTPNLIVMKKSPGSRRSLPSTKRVKGEQRKVNKSKSGDNRKVSKHKIDLWDPLPADKNSVQYLVEPPPPNFVIAKRDSRKSTASSRNSVRFSVVEDAMELAEQLDKTKKGKKIKKEPGERRKSQTSYTEAEFVEGSSDRDHEIEALRIQLQKNLATQPASRDISPDSDYISNSSNRHSRSNSSSSSGSSSSSSSGSSSSESDSRSSSSSSSSGSSSRSSSRSRSSSSSGSSRSSSSSRSESDQERRRKNKYEVKSQDKQTKEKHEDGEVHDGRALLGEASKPRTKTSIICVIL